MLRDRALSRFGAIARALGPPSFETRLIDDEAGRGISLQARYCDLVVIGPTDANESIPVVTHDFPGYVVMNAARPVLIVPCDGRFDEIGRKPLIAWDARTAAARAVTDAIPFLKHAAMVDLAVFDPGERLCMASSPAPTLRFTSRATISALTSRSIRPASRSEMHWWRLPPTWAPI